MMPPGPRPEYPFLQDPRIISVIERHLPGPARSFDRAAGVSSWPSRHLAKKLGISESDRPPPTSASFRNTALLEVKPQFRGGRQRTNFYLFPHPQNGGLSQARRGGVSE